MPEENEKPKFHVKATYDSEWFVGTQHDYINHLVWYGMAHRTSHCTPYVKDVIAQYGIQEGTKRLCDEIFSHPWPAMATAALRSQLLQTLRDVTPDSWHAEIEVTVWTAASI